MGKKKLVVGVVGILAIAGLATGAYGYFTSTGSGDGTGSIGTSNAVSVTDISVSGLTPGGPAQPVSYSFTNTAGNGNQNFGAASVTVNSITPASCTAAIADLSTAASTNAVGTVNDGATFNSDANTEPTITMGDTGSSQDACQSATLHLTVSIAQGS